MSSIGAQASPTSDDSCANGLREQIDRSLEIAGSAALVYTRHGARVGVVKDELSRIRHLVSCRLESEDDLRHSSDATLNSFPETTYLCILLLGRAVVPLQGSASMIEAAIPAVATMSGTLTYCVGVGLPVAVMARTSRRTGRTRSSILVRIRTVAIDRVGKNNFLGRACFMRGGSDKLRERRPVYLIAGVARV